MAKSSDVPYKEMNPTQKAVFILKIVVCILSFGMLFPTIGD